MTQMRLSPRYGPDRGDERLGLGSYDGRAVHGLSPALARWEAVECMAIPPRERGGIP
jgi:hypothetical protein